MINFNLTGQLVTEHSCQHGDYEKSGFIDDSGQLTNERCDSNFSLSDLCGQGFHYLQWEDNDDWITTTYETSDMFTKPDIDSLWCFMNDDSTDSEVLSGSISVHRPDNITDSSWDRVVKHLQGKDWQGNSKQSYCS